MRVTAGMIVEAVATGRTVSQLLADYHYLGEQDLREALIYAQGLRRAANESLHRVSPLKRLR